MTLLLIVSMPRFKTPPPPPNLLPFWKVNLESVAWMPLLMVTTVPAPPASTIVVLAPEPIIVKLMEMVRFSV